MTEASTVLLWLYDDRELLIYLINIILMRFTVCTCHTDLSLLMSCI